MKKEKSQLTQPAQRRYKRQRRKNDIYTTSGGHKNPGSGSPYTVRVKRFGTDRLRFENLESGELFTDKGEIHMRITESGLRKLVVTTIRKVLNEQATEVRGGAWTLAGDSVSRLSCPNHQKRRSLDSRYSMGQVLVAPSLYEGWKAKAMTQATLSYLPEIRKVKLT